MSEQEQFGSGGSQQTENVQHVEGMQQADNSLYTTPDVYQAQSSQDVYQTPDTGAGAGSYDTGGMFSGGRTEQNPYAGSQYDHNPYEKAQTGANQTDAGQYGNNTYGNAYGKNPAGGSQYQNQYGNNQYGNNQYGNSQYGNNQYGYSPYAAPVAKKHTGLIIGIVITVGVLFLIALFGLIYNAFDSEPERKKVKGDTEYIGDFYREYYGDDWYREHRGGEYLEEFYLEYFGDDWYENHLDELEREKERERERENDRDDDDYGYHDDDSYDYDDDYSYDDYNDNYYDDDEYYTLHDDIRDMSYSIEWEYYEYEPDDADVLILVEYPVIVGGHVPNVERINDTIASEISVFTDYYEEEYSNYMYDDDSYFYASATGYVTYMSEDVLSVVYTEYIYTDYYDSVFMYSINVDMEDGVILENTDIIAVDDDFSIDFRYRSDEQNGEIDGLDWLSDQEITALLTSPGNLIIFYTPQGMEIGFNYQDGWVTVTYRDYKDFLKIF